MQSSRFNYPLCDVARIKPETRESEIFGGLMIFLQLEKPIPYGYLNVRVVACSAPMGKNFFVSRVQFEDLIFLPWGIF